MMFAQHGVSLEEVLGPEYLTYRQVGHLLEVSQATVRLLVMRARKLRRTGNPDGVPALPMPIRVSGTTMDVFIKAEISSFKDLREARTAPILAALPTGAAQTAAGRIDVVDFVHPQQDALSDEVHPKA